VSLPPFSEVVAEHGQMVLRLCRSMLPAADAEDAWSETFLAALRAYPDLDAHANVAAWLTTIARRKSIDAIRRRDRHATPTETIADAGVVDDRLDPADADLLAVLATLTERQRLAVVRHHVDGFPFSEVAVLLGSTPAAARRAAADGMAKLRAHYRKEER
jgi:RNA polymerase sigma factor (sigma-70 family)